MRLAEWVYLNVEEVWSAFNLLAEATARGFEAHAVDGSEAEQRVEAFNRAVSIEDKVRMCIKKRPRFRPRRDASQQGPGFPEVAAFPLGA